MAARLLASGDAVAQYEQLPLLLETGFTLSWLRRHGIRLLYPRDGHAFLVGTFQDLGARSLAAACFASLGFHSGKLARYYLQPNVNLPRRHTLLHIGREIRDRLSSLSAEQTPRAELVRESAQELPRKNSNSQADPLETLATDVYLRYVEDGADALDEEELKLLWQPRVGMLLETVGLALHNETWLRLLRTRMPNVWDGLESSEFDRLVAAIGSEIGEVGTWFQSDFLMRFAASCEVPTNEVLPRALPPDPDPIDPERPTLAHLGDFPSRQRVVTALQKLIPGAPRETVLAAVERAMLETKFTPAGRMIGPAWEMTTRRTLFLATMDEVLKVSAFAIVHSGYRLWAITETAFVIEAHEAELDTVQAQLTKAIDQAQIEILGPLRAPLAWRIAREW